jgi:putative DNA primase/helicase
MSGPFDTASIRKDAGRGFCGDGAIAQDIIAFYAQRGLAVFPCHYPIINGTACCSCGNPNCPDPAKHPYGRRAPHGLKDASADPRKIERWWGTDVPYNIAVAAGAMSGIVVLDVDPRHQGDANLVRLEAEHGPLPLTWRAISGSLGEHIYFAHPGCPVSNSAGKIADGIDVRGDGGYVIAPPSRHISGRRYAWNVDHHPEFTELAPMPAWLIDMAGAASRGGRQDIDWKQFAATPIAEGKRHDSLKRLAGLLFYRLSREPHLAAQLILDFNQQHCTPPLDEEELLRIIDWAAAREIQRRKAGDARA